MLISIKNIELIHCHLWWFMKTPVCLASWFFGQENWWIVAISSQDLGNYSRQSSQDFARFFKIVEKNPRRFLEFLAIKARIFKILAKETRKSCIKVIQDLVISQKQLSLKTQERGYSCVCVHLKLNLVWPTKNEAKINWNKMEVKIKYIEMKIMVQTSAVKMYIFLNLLWVYKGIDFALAKILFKLLPLSARNLNPTEINFLNSSFSKRQWTFQSNLPAPKRWLKSKQIEKQKKRTGRTFWKVVFQLHQFLSKSFKKLFWKWRLQWRMKCSGGTCPLVCMFRSASGVNFDRDQLKRFVKFSKWRKRSHRMSFIFTKLQKHL